MTEKEFFIECIPQITGLAMEIQKTTALEYMEFKRECLEEIGRTCPKALGFIKKALFVIECSLAG